MYNHWTMSTSLLMLLLNTLLSDVGTLVLCNPDLTPSVPDGSAVYVNQPITITCITTNSQALAWRSDQYIGPGQQLSFNSGSMPGTMETSPNGAEATFVRMDNINGELTLQSILRISVVPAFTTFTVTCRNIDTGVSESVTYQTRNENITSVTRLPFEAGRTCPNSNITFECTARNSQNIQWGISPDIGLSNLMLRCSSGGEPQTYNIDGITVISFAQVLNSDDGLVCRLALLTEGLPVDTPLYVTCINLDFQISARVSFEIPGDCIPTVPITNSVTTVVPSSIDSGSGYKPTIDVTPTQKSMTSKFVIIGGVGGLIGVIIGVIIVAIVVITAIIIIIAIIVLGKKIKDKDKVLCHMPDEHMGLKV